MCTSTNHFVYLTKPTGLIRTFLRLRAHFFPRVPFPFALPWGGSLLLHGDEFENTMLWGGGLEQAEVNVIAAILKPGMVFVDVGANQGLYTIIASKSLGPRGRVHSFEPAPSEFSKLRGNLRVNRCRNVTANQAAVGATNGQAIIYACEPYKGMYSSLRPPAAEDALSVRPVPVRTASLDSYAHDNCLEQLDVLKIDVEGGERDVMTGATEVIEKYKPIILCEFSDRRTSQWGYQASEVADSVVRFGYKWFQVNSEGLQEHHVQPYYDYENLLAVPECKLGLVSELLSRNQAIVG